MAKKITKWEPDDFELEMTTHWSFPKRGDWATHDAKWRGNWSPYIPRNIILRYSKEGDLVLDQFAGGGTKMVRICLYRYSEFNVYKLLADTIIPWTVEWLYFYELWLATGEWLGGGEHPDLDRKKTAGIFTHKFYTIFWRYKE